MLQGFGRSRRCYSVLFFMQLALQDKLHETLPLRDHLRDAGCVKNRVTGHALLPFLFQKLAAVDYVFYSWIRAIYRPRYIGR